MKDLPACLKPASLFMPRTDMRSQMKEMDLELGQYHTSSNTLELMIGELKLKMEGMQREFREQSEVGAYLDFISTCE